jgi:Tfp pilus assembly protein PilF
LEKDIEERGKRRKTNRQAAEKLKERGNNYMKENHFRSAIKKYNEALEVSKDYFMVYTNRALAKIKLERYEVSLLTS